MFHILLEVARRNQETKLYLSCHACKSHFIVPVPYLPILHFSFKKIPLFLRISHTFTVKYGLLYTHFLLQILLLASPYSSQLTVFVFVFYNPLSSVSVAHIGMGVGPAIGVWESYW